MNRSLLIVEDDLDQLEILACSFIRAGYRVISVHHPRQALEAASFRQFQVALLDDSLPEMDAAELMRRLKQTQDAVQVIILSGCEDPKRRAKVDGAFACLGKPWTTALLEATVEDAFERAVDESPLCEQAALTN